MALSTNPYKGARDFYPDDKRLQKYMFTVWRQVAERFGYEEYDAPILEPLDLYLAKTGEEIVNEQTYSFTDRGGRDVVIRPEMTPSVSRMVAARRQELAYPLRWYSIPNLWRYERPQRGRLREHWQLNVDIFGVQSIAAEEELILLVDTMFKQMGADASMYRIQINHRGLVNYLLADYLHLDEVEQHAVGKLIDRMHKMEQPKFISALDAVITGRPAGDSTVEQLLSLLHAQSIDELPQQVQDHEAVAELQMLLQQLAAAGVTNVSFDPTLMRGFDYYTGIIFEVSDTDSENNRSMMGGGRYDGLVGLFGVQPVPTVGFGWGDVTMAHFLESHRLLPEDMPDTDIYLLQAGTISQPLQSVAQQLRGVGLNVAIDLSGRKLGDGLKTATKKGIKYAVIVGEAELSAGKYMLRSLADGNEAALTISEIAQRIK